MGPRAGEGPQRRDGGLDRVDQRHARSARRRSVDPEVVVIEARKVAQRAVAPVVPIGALSRYDRPKPTLNGYDTLLEASS